MRCVTLSGWGQPADSLAGLLPNSESTDYGSLANVNELYNALALRAPDIVIGWSLGGQLAIRAVAEKAIAPKLLVLLAAPFQCAASEDYAAATPMQVLRAFRNLYKVDPVIAGGQFQGLIAEGDGKKAEILDSLLLSEEITKKDKWIPWFDELIHMSCLGLDFSGFPPTLIAHGKQDAVIPCAQAGMFASRIAQSESWLIPDCGHAPHLHDADKLRDFISKRLQTGI